MSVRVQQIKWLTQMYYCRMTSHLFEGLLFALAELFIFKFPLAEFSLQLLNTLTQCKLVSARHKDITFVIFTISGFHHPFAIILLSCLLSHFVSILQPRQSRMFFLSYSLSFSRTFWDSSRRSCRALSLLESSSIVLMSSQSCLLRSSRLRPEEDRELARLTEALPPWLSQSYGSPSGALEQRTDSRASRSCQIDEGEYEIPGRACL